ncbi:MAG: DUF2911 domain-containing protein, partial [Eudoraea sp.]|nr:DUF2911 domain-containing protein [Eudoraea sp.]
MKYLIAFGLLCYSPLLLAQITHPKASPFSQLTQQIGLSNITIEYSRPARKGRKIFGDLVPYGRIWRVGANESTKFTADTDIIVKGKILPKGTYALYAFPGQASWELVFHSNISHWGDGRDAYNPAEDVFRITVIPRTIPYLQENFLITFDLLDHNSATMKWIWEHTEIRIPIKVPTDDLMMQRIKEKLRDAPGAQTYYEAARYLQEQQKDHTTALGYL